MVLQRLPTTPITCPETPQQLGARLAVIESMKQMREVSYFHSEGRILDDELMADFHSEISKAYEFYRECYSLYLLVRERPSKKL